MQQNKKSYYEQKNTYNIIKIRELLREMPTWFGDFLRANENTLAPLTRLNYCFDTKIFLNYLITEHALFNSCSSIRDISTEQISKLTLRDLEIYIEYLGYYIKKDIEIENKERGKARKIASLRCLFKYLFKCGLIDSNPAELISMPKIHEQAIIRLEPNEIADLIDIVESGEGLTEQQKKYHTITAKRDIAIIVLFLTTGIRISELVGLNIEDINFEDLSFQVTRKGGNQSILYFDYETENALIEYLEQRKVKGTYELSSPLFLSMRNQRMSVRSVEYLVKKYAKLASPLKHITPHKLRSTYGTMLYKESGDIYLVADVLGHKDVNTTRKHYAAMSEDNKRRASKLIKLKDD